LGEELNFTRAAERANLSQTAFSRSIQSLEAGMGLRMFDRGTRSVQITSTGRQLIARARRLLAHAQDLAREIEGIAQADGGDLAFGASLMAIDGVLRGVLPSITRQRPNLRLSVEVSRWQVLQQHLEQGRIEFFVGYPGSLAKDPGFAVTLLPPQPTSIFCRPGHPLLASGQHPSPMQVPRFPWAIVQMPDDLGAQMRAIFGMAPDAPLPLALSCDNQSLLREATLTSDVLLFTWCSWLIADIRDGAVVDLGKRMRPALPRAAMQLDCAIVQLAGRTASPAAQSLIDLISPRKAQDPR
jgi:DNA-binding transcriptional LysR family regulator